MRQKSGDYHLTGSGKNHEDSTAEWEQNVCTVSLKKSMHGAELSEKYRGWE